MMPACEHCGKPHAKIVERTIASDYSVERLLLCTPCRRAAGFTMQLEQHPLVRKTALGAPPTLVMR